MTLGRVFVDTGAWVALQVSDDEHHQVATETIPHLMVGCKGLVTSNLVVGETYTPLPTATGSIHSATGTPRASPSCVMRVSGMRLPLMCISRPPALPGYPPTF